MVHLNHEEKYNEIHNAHWLLSAMFETTNSRTRGSMYFIETTNSKTQGSMHFENKIKHRNKKKNEIQFSHWLLPVVFEITNSLTQGLMHIIETTTTVAYK